MGRRPRSRTQPTAQGRLTKVGTVAEAVGVETAESTEVESVKVLQYAFLFGVGAFIAWSFLR